MSKIKWRYADDGLEQESSLATALVIPTDKDGNSLPHEDRTRQDGKDDADINVLLARYGVKNDKWPTSAQLAALPVSGQRALYGDFTGETDFQLQQNAIIDAREAFLALPAKVRKEFDNDPAKLLEFVHDDKNYEKAKELGLLAEPKPAPKPQEVVVKGGRLDPDESASKGPPEAK